MQGERTGPTAHHDQGLAEALSLSAHQEAAAIDLVHLQTDVISEEWAREELGDMIQAEVAAHLQNRQVH